MSKLAELKESVGSSFQKIGEAIRDSEAFQQLRAKYDELDGQAKLYINLGALAAVVLVVFSTVLFGIAKVNTLKSEMSEREELIGYLQRSADQIRQLRMQAQSSPGGGVNLNSSLPQFVESVAVSSGINKEKLEIGQEQTVSEDKDSSETAVDVKMERTNLRALSRLLFGLTEQGSPQNVNIKNLEVDTKGDPEGYIDVTFSVSTHRAK